MKQELEYQYEGTEFLFKKSQHTSQLAQIKKLLQQQFNGDRRWSSNDQCENVLRRAVFLRFNSTKEGLLYFSLAFRTEKFVEEIRKKDRVQVRGDRNNNLNLINEMMKINEQKTDNPMQELFSAIKFFSGRKDILKSGLFSCATLNQAKQLFYPLVQLEEKTKKVRECFFKLNVNLLKDYPSKNRRNFWVKSLRKAERNHLLYDEQRFCYAYLLQRSKDPQMGFWIVVVQSLRESIENEMKSKQSYEHQNYIELESDQEESQVKTDQSFYSLSQDLLNHSNLSQASRTNKEQVKPRVPQNKKVTKQPAQIPLQYDKAEPELVRHNVDMNGLKIWLNIALVLFIIIFVILNGKQSQSSVSTY